MEITEIHNVTLEKEVIIGIKCDICGRDIHGRYWTLISGHRDWGNDSCDSVEHFELCSEKCVQSKIKDYFKDCEHSHTQYFELDQDFWDKD